MSKIVVTGGMARPAFYELTGSLGTDVLEQVPSAGDPRLGRGRRRRRCRRASRRRGTIRRLIARRGAAQGIIAADSSNVGRRAFAPICAASEINVLVTDTGIAPHAARLKAAGVHVDTT